YWCASGRADAWWRSVNGSATLSSTSPPRRGRPTASAAGAGVGGRKRGGMASSQTRRCLSPRPCWIRATTPISGKSCFVANFAQEVVKRQWPLSVGRLSGQGVEQFGRSAALVSVLHPHLSFLDHVHELNANQRILGCVKRLKPQHRPCHPLHCSMLLLHD